MAAPRVTSQRFRHTAFAVAFGLLGAGLASALATPMAAAQDSAQVASGDPYQAVLRKAIAQVDWQRAQTKLWQRALLDMLLLTGDSIRTGSESRAELQYGDGSLTRIGSLTTLTLTGDKKREIKLDGGTIWMNIRKNGAGMRIITPGAIAAVTGTELMVEFDALRRTTEVTVFEGSVNVTGDVGNLVKVVAGTTSRVPFHQPALAPTPLDNSKIEERNRLYHPLSIEEPATSPSSKPDTVETPGAPTVVTPSTAPTTAVTQPNTTHSTAPNPTVNDPAGTPTSTTTAPVNPDLKGQNQQLNDPRLINGSPTTGRVKVIIQ